ncbi:MAG: transposase [Planctomycetota bacterium]
MPGKKHAAEQIVRKLRTAEVELARGPTVSAVCKRLQIAARTYYRWRKEFGSMQVSRRDGRRSWRENGRLKRLLTDAELATPELAMRI